MLGLVIRGQESVFALKELDAMDGNVLGVGGKSSKIADAAAENRSAGLGHGDHDCVDRRSPLRRRPNGGSASHESLGKLLCDVAGLQEPVDQNVVPLTAAKALDQHHRRDERRPESVTLEHCDHRCSVLAVARQSGNPARVEDEQVQEARESASPRRIRRERASAFAVEAAVGLPTLATSSSR